VKSEIICPESTDAEGKAKREVLRKAKQYRRNVIPKEIQKLGEAMRTTTQFGEECNAEIKTMQCNPMKCNAMQYRKQHTAEQNAMQEAAQCNARSEAMQKRFASNRHVDSQLTVSPTTSSVRDMKKRYPSASK
jgi:hypothetical protein